MPRICAHLSSFSFLIPHLVDLFFSISSASFVEALGSRNYRERIMLQGIVHIFILRNLLIFA